MLKKTRKKGGIQKKLLNPIIKSFKIQKNKRETYDSKTQRNYRKYW